MMGASYKSKKDSKLMDFTLTQDGFHFLVRPNNQEAKDWLSTHTGGQWFGRSLFVEGRYIDDLVNGIASAGFSI